MDVVPLTRSVLFIGDYFSLISTVALNEDQRRDGESDEDLAVRIAGEFMLEYYGWDVAAVSNDIGVVDADDGPTCPNCESDNWDFLVNDSALCRDCGHRWKQEVEPE